MGFPKQDRETHFCLEWKDMDLDYDEEAIEAV